MTAVTQIYAGARLTAAMLRAVAPLSAYKASNQSSANSTTLANDSALAIALQANAVYSFLAILGYNGGSQGSSDLKIGWALPSGSSMGYSLYGNTTGGSATDGPWYTGAATPALGTNGGGTNLGGVAQGTVATGSTAGSLQLQWAKNSTADPTVTTVLAGSILLAWQVQ